MIRTYYIYQISVYGFCKLIGTHHQLKDAKEATEFLRNNYSYTGSKPWYEVRDKKGNVVF